MFIDRILNIIPNSGKKVQVSNDGEKWRSAFYVGSVDGLALVKISPYSEKVISFSYMQEA